MRKIGGMGGRMMIALGGLLLLFAACEKDVLPRGSGRKVAVKFVIGGTGDAVRGFNALEMKPKTTVVHLRDSLYMYAKLVPDTTEDDMRVATTSPLIEGQHVHMEAYFPDESWAGSADYHANAAGNLVLDNPNLPLEVDPSLGPFHFTAYSYYKSTDPISETGIDPTVSDLIWGEAKNQTIDETESGRTVTMVLKHCFSRVRVKINVVGIANTTITNVGTISIGGKKADLDVMDGSLTPTASAVTQTVSDWEDANGDALSSPFSEEVIVSGYAVVYPSPTKVTIGSITLNVGGSQYPFTNCSASFSETLTPGQHYTLVIDMKKLVFAGSNIYWNGSALVFSESGNSTTKGVLFKWGSLRGVSVEGALYTPIEGGTWDDTKNTKNYPNYVAFNTIEFTKTGISDDLNENYLYNQGFDMVNYRGDICSYLTNGVWRLPNAAEFGNATDYSHNTGATGQYYYSASGNAVFFPLNGYAWEMNGQNQNPTTGYYWSGTPGATAAEAHAMILNGDGVVETPPRPNSRNTGMSVRCVKAN